VTEVQKDVQVPRTSDAVTLFSIGFKSSILGRLFVLICDYRGVPGSALVGVTTPAESSRIRQIKLRLWPWPFSIMVCYMFYKFPVIMFDQIT
jgi:hypothetical protein